MSLVLVIISGICWTAVYIDSIRLGFKQKTYAMPLFALGLNIVWEMLYSVDGLFIHKEFMLAQAIANLVWAIFDIAIVVTYFKYGKKYMPENAQKYFIPYSLLAFAACALFQFAFYFHFDSVVAASQYSAFGQNAVMSILFLVMLFKRGNTEGQSLLIGICKLIGTLAPTIQGGFVESINIYIILTGAICLIFDILYIVFFCKFRKNEKQASVQVAQ